MTKRMKAIQWMKGHPHVVDMFRQFGRQMVQKTRCFGINSLRERVRWECVYEYGDGYKFPNDVSPYIARFLLWEDPRWGDYMRCKRTKDEDTSIILITQAEIDAA